MRGRMYGSTDIHKLRTCTSPSCGGGTSTVASSKCSDPSTPLGLLFKRISRDEIMTADSLHLLEKIAYGDFFGLCPIPGGKKRGFCRLPSRVATPGPAPLSPLVPRVWPS